MVNVRTRFKYVKNYCFILYPCEVFKRKCNTARRDIVLIPIYHSSTLKNNTYPFGDISEKKLLLTLSPSSPNPGVFHRTLLWAYHLQQFMSLR